MELTDRDEQLIALLRNNGRISVSDIARKMSVSRTAAQMRLQKLERNGVITGYSVNLSSEYLKSRVKALVMIKFAPVKRKVIEEQLAAISSVTALYSISGEFDMAAVISAASTMQLDIIIDQIGCLEGIDETMSSIILSTKFDRQLMDL